MNSLLKDMTKPSIKEHIYQFERNKVIFRSILTWILLGAQVVFSLLIVYHGVGYEALIGLNLFLSLLTVPSLIIHKNHLEHSKNAKLILRYNTITSINPTEEITLNNADIIEVVLHKGLYGFKVPWFDYSWFELVDKEGQTIKVSFYLMDISELWMDTLSRKVGPKMLVEKNVFFPLIK